MVGSIVVGLALAVGAAVQLTSAAPLPVSRDDELAGVIGLARAVGGGLLAIGLVWLVVDVVRVRVRMRQLAHDVASATKLGRLDMRLASALNDPSVVVGYWFETEARYVSTSGMPLERSPAEAEQSHVAIERGGRPIASIWHRRGIEPRTIRKELTSSLLIALDNERLQAVGMANLRALAPNLRRRAFLNLPRRQRARWGPFLCG